MDVGPFMKPNTILITWSYKLPSTHSSVLLPIHSRICLLTDNSTVVGYINKMGGMASPSLNHLTRKLWVWCLEREIFVVAQHIPGKDNVNADYYFRNFIKRI